MVMQNKRLAYIPGTVAIILLIPLVAMQFTSEVDWSASVRAVAGSTLFNMG